MNLTHVHAQAVCARGDRKYIVNSGDTLSGIASQSSISYQSLAAYNHIADPNVIYPDQLVCIPSKGGTNSSSWTSTPVNTSVPTSSSVSSTTQHTTYTPSAPVAYTARVSSDSSVATNNHNVFPYPACTYWANQRFYQVHGVFVPWTVNAQAWQWTARANDFGWHVSSSPSVGSIINLQPWVGGAYGGGHVAYVEQVLPNGHVIASNMSWGANPYAVAYVEFAPGPGVTFISE